MARSRHIEAAIFLVVLHYSTSISAKESPSPIHEVFEVINEQARVDDKRIQTSPGLLPYGNPLAGNSQHNAKLHAQNQQAMFNAERVRQHRAQLQRLNLAPKQSDSYMRAYHESQENHQLALEQQQSNLKEKKPSSTPSRTSNPSRASPSRAASSSRTTSSTRSSAASRSPPASRTPTRQRQSKRPRGPDLATIMQEESELKDKNRNHRSYGSVEYQQYLQPRKYKTVYVTAGPTYDEGVTIKPNGNIGVSPSEMYDESTQLYTQAVPSETHYVYPKQYNQMQHYQSAQDIASLNALLKREPDDQLTELNALIESDKQSHKELETPVDLYFYLKDPSLAQHYANSMYAHVPEYASAYMPQIKDHTPITEEIDDIEDPNKVVKRPYTSQPTYPPSTTLEVTPHNINHYAAPTLPTIRDPHKPSFEALKYEKPLTFYSQDVRQEDTSQRYLHHNVKHNGIQHLNEDGSGVSAYGDDNLHYAASYEFGYHVRDHTSGNNFGHQEAKKDGNTDGQYHVLLPDGRMQNVKYHAGPDGFHADISYDSQRK